jgi:hypothetical protein
VLAPDGSGNAINSDSGMIGISDEHQSVFAPGTLQGNSDYLFFVATRAKGGAPSTSVVVLSGGTGPHKNGQWTTDFAKTDGYGAYPNGYDFCCTHRPKLSHCRRRQPGPSGPNLRLNLRRPGIGGARTQRASVSLLMIYEGTNTCLGTTGGNNNGNFYSSVGIATSLDYGHTWPTYRGKNGFTFVSLPSAHSTQGPNAPAEATSGGVCMGNDCTLIPLLSYGRYPVLSPSVPISTAGALGVPIPSSMGDSEMSGFLDDASRVRRNTFTRSTTTRVERVL